MVFVNCSSRYLLRYVWSLTKHETSQLARLASLPALGSSYSMVFNHTWFPTSPRPPPTPRMLETQTQVLMLSRQAPYLPSPGNSILNQHFYQDYLCKAHSAFSVDKPSFKENRSTANLRASKPGTTKASIERKRQPPFTPGTGCQRRPGQSTFILVQTPGSRDILFKAEYSKSSHICLLLASSL